MEKAIQKAIEGGYKGLEWTEDIRCVEQNKAYLGYIWGHSKDGEAHGRPACDIIFDPLFWQSLGKACGWNEKETKNVWHTGLHGVVIPESRYRWHCFIDHLAEGKDAGSFFNSLLK